MMSREPTETTTSRAQMDALVDAHYRAEERVDLGAIVRGFQPDAEHDVAGRGDPLHGTEHIASFYRGLLADLRITRFQSIRRWYGEDHVADESLMFAVAAGRPFGLKGDGRAVQARVLHVFDFANGLISRESAWFDVVALQRQLTT